MFLSTKMLKLLNLENSSADSFSIFGFVDIFKTLRSVRQSNVPARILRILQCDKSRDTRLGRCRKLASMTFSRQFPDMFSSVVFLGSQSGIRLHPEQVKHSEVMYVDFFVDAVQVHWLSFLHALSCPVVSIPFFFVAFSHSWTSADNVTMRNNTIKQLNFIATKAKCLMHERSEDISHVASAKDI